MKVIFLDFDGTLNVLRDFKNPNEKEIKEKRVKILADICKKYDCKVVIESAHKTCIDEKTLETDVEWIKEFFSLFKKYGIECIGITPYIGFEYDEEGRTIVDYNKKPWKEDEIRLYLFRHPEVDSYVVIDDDDLAAMHRKSDLDKVRNHLVKTSIYEEANPNEEGLLEKHIDEVGEKLKLENEIKKFALRKKTKDKSKEYQL